MLHLFCRNVINSLACVPHMRVMYCCACGKDLSSCVKERSLDGDARGPLEPRKRVISVWKELSSVLLASNTASAPG